MIPACRDELARRNHPPPGFPARNASGKVPLLERDDGRYLAESDAILLYPGEGTPFVSDDACQRALVYQWLFFEQYSHEPFVAVRRALMVCPQRAAQATSRSRPMLDAVRKLPEFRPTDWKPAK